MSKVNNEYNVEKCREEAGFTLVEAVIALVILTIAILGVFAAFTFSTRYNTGNNTRSQSLSVLQQEIESLRSAKFTPAIIDIYPPNLDLSGGVKTARTVPAGNGQDFVVETTIDDDPFTTGVQIDAARPMKEITIQVTPITADGNWVTAYRTRAVFRRVRAN